MTSGAGAAVQPKEPTLKVAISGTHACLRISAAFLAALVLFPGAAVAQLTYFDADVVGYEITDSNSSSAAVVNLCDLPVEVEVLVDTYPPAPIAGPILLALAPGELKTVELDLEPTVDGIAYANIEVVPAPNPGRAARCFTPGSSLVRGALAAFSRSPAPEAVRSISQRKVESSRRIDPAPRRREGRVVALLPLAPGDRLHLAVSNPCGIGMPLQMALHVSGGTNPVVVNVNTVLAPGERRVIAPDIPPRAIAGSTWGWMVIVPPTMRPSAGCSSNAAEWFLNVLPAGTSEPVRATTLLPDTSFAPGPNR